MDPTWRFEPWLVGGEAAEDRAGFRVQGYEGLGRGSYVIRIGCFGGFSSINIIGSQREYEWCLFGPQYFGIQRKSMIGLRVRGSSLCC